jgi:hypothetical protein
MDIIKRVKNVIVAPKQEWPTIEAENAHHVKVLTTYVVSLALIPAIAAFIGYGLIGYTVFGIHIGSVSFGVRQAIVQYITMLGGVYLAAYVIDALAKNFGATKNFNQAFSLVAYSYTPAFIGGVFHIHHSISWLAMVAGIYSLYLLYIGLKPMMKAPAEKQTSYFVVSLLVMILAMILISAILSAFLLRGMMPRF